MKMALRVFVFIDFFHQEGSCTFGRMSELSSTQRLSTFNFLVPLAKDFDSSHGTFCQHQSLLAFLHHFHYSKRVKEKLMKKTTLLDWYES